MIIRIDDFSGKIAKALTDMEQDVVEQMNTAIEETAKDTVSELRSTSPVGKGKKSGSYAKGWTVKERGTNHSKIRSLSVCNHTQYMLTHLLEYGHIIKKTGGRTKAISHIKPAEEHAQDELTEKVEDIKL